MIRRFHGSAAAQIQVKNLLKSVGSAWTKAPSQAMSPQVVQALQTLRQSLGTNSGVRQSVLDLLQKIDKQSHSPQIYQALDKSLATNQLEVDDLQKMYQTVVTADSKGDLTSKLFIKLHKSSKLQSAVHAQNSLLYFEWLIKNKTPSQAVKFLQGVLKQFSLSDEQISVIVQLLNTKDGVCLLPQVFAALESFPSPATIEAAILNIVEFKDTQALENLTNVLVKSSPLAKRSMIVLLDAHLTLDTNGKRVLKLMPKDDSLAYLELLLMATMQFGVEKFTGEALVSSIRAHTDKVKETTDLLLQWEMYSKTDIKDLIESCDSCEVDSLTLSGLLKIADVARRPESDIAATREHFEQLGIHMNAAGYAILIRRALSGVEIDKARKLFIESVQQGVDWEQNNELHASALSQLLCELCKSTHLDESIKFDTYQRIRLVVSGISYDAQLEMLKMFLSRENTSDLATFLIEQWGEAPNLNWHSHKEMYTAFYDQLMGTSDYKLAWELYRIFNTTINLPHESYMPIQQKFCSLGRPDAAHLMFRHLRNRAKKEGMPPPSRQMYLMLFVEYGRWMYEEGMTELEAYLRMDLNTELDIDLMNAMLIGYSALSDSPKVRDLWYETNGFAFGKGFNNLTATALLKHLAPMSLEAVDDLWCEMPSKYGIKANEDNLCQYIVANCYHGYYSRALEIVREAPKLYGVPISKNIISTLYNWTLIDSRKEKVSSWASKEFPEEWAALKSENKLQQILVENPDGDSDDHARYEAIRALKNQTGGPLLQAMHKTTDVD